MKTLTQHDQLLVKPYIDAKIKSAMENIASVETSPTANSYSEGEYLIFNDILYVATKAIAVGDTLDPTPTTGNIEESDDIMAMLQELANRPTSSNRNFLDNPFFTVNQRGQSRYVGDIYGVDRWKSFYPTSIVDVYSDGIEISTSEGGSNFISQRHDDFTNLSGKVVTISCLKSSSNRAVLQLRKNGAYDSGYSFGDSGNYITWTVRMPTLTSSDTIDICLEGSDKIYAIKLELGEVSTLALDTAPDYVTELAKCRASKADPADTFANQGDIIQAKVFGELGAKNLLPNKATTQTINGVTFTVNSDGSVTANGTATANAIFWLINQEVLSSVIKNAGNYIITCGPNASGDISLFFGVEYNSTWTIAEWVQTKAGKNITLTNEMLSNDNYSSQIYLYIREGTTVSNITFKPMLRPASITDDTYVPYAMTNKNLSDKLTSLTKGTMRRVSIISPLNGWAVIQFPPCNTVTLNGISLYGMTGDKTNEFSIVGTDQTQGIMILSCSNSSYYNYFAAIDITLT